MRSLRNERLQVLPSLPELETRTIAYVNGIISEDAPEEIKEACSPTLRGRCPVGTVFLPGA